MEYNETQHSKRCQCENVLGFTCALMILGFLIDAESHLLCATFKDFRVMVKRRIKI